MLALIDADVITYKVGFAAQTNMWSVVEEGNVLKVSSSKKDINDWIKDNPGEYELIHDIIPDPPENALHSVKMLIRRILEGVAASDYKLYLTGKGNFRNEIYSEYKANRKDKPKPVHYQLIRDYMVEVWQAEIVDGMEADDQLGIDQKGDETIICSIDKDLLTIPGWNYDMTTKERIWVTPLDARRAFYKQMITGDTADNIPGLSEKKPLRRTYPTAPIDDMETKEEMEEYAYAGYHTKYMDEDEAKKMYDMNYDLLWIRR